MHIKLPHSIKLNYADNTEPLQIKYFIVADGSSGFKAEAGRYHLYVSLACPFASRTVVGRKLKGLEDAISMDIVYYATQEDGFHFNPKVNIWI